MECFSLICPTVNFSIPNSNMYSTDENHATHDAVLLFVRYISVFYIRFETNILHF